MIVLKPKSLLLGFLIGGVAGGIATLLAAPAPGEETRRKISSNKEAWARELKELKDSLMEIKNSVTTVSSEGKAVLADFLKDIKLSVYEWQLSTEQNKLALQNDINEINQTIAELEKDLAKQQEQA